MREFLKIWLEVQPPPNRKGGEGVVQGCKDQRWLRGRERDRKLCYDTYIMLFCSSYTESLVLWFPWFYVDWQSCCTSFWTDINKKTIIQANSPLSYMVLYWTVVVTVKVTSNMSMKFTFLFNYLPPTFILIEECIAKYPFTYLLAVLWTDALKHTY